MAQLFRLSDKAWGQIEPYLPHRQLGKPRVDDRRVISGILHVLKVGCRWQRLPPMAQTRRSTTATIGGLSAGSRSGCLPRSQPQAPFQTSSSSMRPT